MAYERHNWTCGEVVTNDRLNNIEDGIEQALECCGGGDDKGLYLVTFAYRDGAWTVDRTLAEVIDAINAGYEVVGEYAYADATTRYQLANYYASHYATFSSFNAFRDNGVTKVFFETIVLYNDNTIAHCDTVLS